MGVILEHLKKSFINPSEEFTPIPFWFWNDYLESDEILSQLQDFYEKGVTGFVLHPRIGIPKEIGYLSERFMELVSTAINEAARLNMTVILYDEGMYPSGSANGQVVQENPLYASKGLQMQEYACKAGENQISLSIDKGEEIVSVQAVEKDSTGNINMEHSKVLSPNQEKVHFTPPNDSQWSVLVFKQIFSKGTIRGIHYGQDDGEKFAPASADLLKPEAVEAYIRLTHEVYYSNLESHFGNTIIAMFTDEPDMLGRNSLPGLKPWSEQFLSYYLESGNREEYLPALWLEVGSQTSEIRESYRKTVNKRLTETYYKPISEWCHTHGIALTGHPAASDDIGLLKYFQIPGQDVVWRWVAPEDELAITGPHSTAGKCSADAARHHGRRRNLNEVLGVCGKDNSWNLSAGDMKWYFDWLFIRGVNLISPHAFYYSVNERSRSHERPPDVGRNNSWWPFYKEFAQYIKRMSWMMTDSVNSADIAILCREDHLPWMSAKPLYENQLEFNYLEEALLMDEVKWSNGKIHIQKQTYSILLIEKEYSLQDRLIKKLEDFINEGGKVVLIDHDMKIQGANYCTLSNIDDLLTVLTKGRHQPFHVFPTHKDLRVSHVRKHETSFFVLVNEGEERIEGSLYLNETGKVEQWNAWKGEILEVGVNQGEASNEVPFLLERRESIIFSVNNSLESSQRNLEEKEIHEKQQRALTTWDIKGFKQKSLQSWTGWENMKYFSGTVHYETNFHMEECQSVTLHLGEVYEIANVIINGKHLSTKMWAPYTFEVPSSYIEKGENTLLVEVTNSKANEMDQIALPSGLLGPVTIEW